MYKIAKQFNICYTKGVVDSPKGDDALASIVQSTAPFALEIYG